MPHKITAELGFIAQCGHFILCGADYWEIPRGRRLVRICCVCNGAPQPTSRTPFNPHHVNLSISSLGFCIVLEGGRWCFKPTNSPVFLTNRVMDAADPGMVPHYAWRDELKRRIQAAVREGSHALSTNSWARLRERFSYSLYGRSIELAPMTRVKVVGAGPSPDIVQISVPGGTRLLYPVMSLAVAGVPSKRRARNE